MWGAFDDQRRLVALKTISRPKAGKLEKDKQGDQEGQGGQEGQGEQDDSATVDFVRELLILRRLGADTIAPNAHIVRLLDCDVSTNTLVLERFEGTLSKHIKAEGAPGGEGASVPRANL